MIRVLSVRGIVLGLLLCAPLFGIDRDRRLDQLYHTAWTAKDGAPTYSRAWAETPDGFLWFGNPSGLYRFDGARFERYDVLSDVAMPKTSVSAMITLADGSLLIGWSLGGISRLKDGQFKEYGGPNSGFPQNAAVERFQKGGDGSVWALVNNRGVFRLDDGGSWHQIGSELAVASNSMTLYYIDRQGSLWLGSEKEIFFLRRGENKFKEIRSGGRAMAQSADGSLWLQSANSILSVDRDGIGAEIMAASRGLDFGEFIFADSAGSIWSGGNGKGILRIAHPENKAIGKQVTVEKFTAQDGLTHDIVTGIFEDREGNVWILTNKGIDSFRQSNVVPVKFPTSGGYAFLDGSAEDIRVIAFVPGSVMTIKNGSVAEVRPWGFKTLYVYHGKNDVTWLGTEDRGVAKVLNDRGQPVDTPGVGVGAITEDEKGRLWAAIGGRGLMGLEDGKWRSIREFGGPPQRPISSFTDSKKRTWFGLVDNHVAMMSQGKVTTFGTNEGVRVGICLDIREAAGTIFIGGEHALEMFDGRNFLPIVPNDRESFGNVWALLGSDQSGLWFDETRGLVHIPSGEISRIKNDPKHRVSYELFDFHDGLPSDLQRTAYRPASFETPDGRIWFATEGGVVWIDPNRIVHNSISPGVAVDSLTANGMVYHFHSAIALPARTTSLRIAFTAASMTVPERVRFRYKLDEVDKDWQDSGTRRETMYTKLGPGSYRFRLAACNNDGVWNEGGTVASFMIAPTFYQTSWFQGLCILAAGLLLAGAYRLRVRQIAGAMNARFNERLAERTRIARDLHDTLLQGFQGLMLRLQAIDESLPPGEVKDELERTLDRGDQVVAESRKAVQDLRLSTVVTNDLARAVRTIGDELSSEGSATFELLVEGETRELHPIVRDEVYRITREALRNSFAHAQASHIETEITYGEQVFRLRIRDDGAGIAPALLENGRPGHYGLPGMRERAAEIGAKLDIWSGNGTGTEIDLSIAGSIAYEKKPGRFPGKAE